MSGGELDGSKTRRRAATFAVLLALVVAAFEGTVVTAAMPTVTAELGGRSLYGWVFSSFLVASAIGVLVCGKLADGYGRRPVFIGGTCLFLVGSMLCGAANGIVALIAFRVVQGLGAGAIQPVAMTIVSDLYTIEERARLQGLLTGAWGGANILGPILGGAIVGSASWRWVFFVNVPFASLAVIVLAIAYRDPEARGGGAGGAGAAVLAGVATSAALLALEPKLPTHVPFAVAAALIFVVLVRQQRRASRPLVPFRLLRDRIVIAGLVGGAFAGGVLYVAAAFVPLWVSARAARPVFAGIPLIFLLGGWALGSTFGVHVLVRRGMRASVAGGYAIALLGALALAYVVKTERSTALAFAALTLLGLGLGPAASTSLVAPQNHVGWRDRGVVTSTMYASRTLGGSIAIAIVGATTDEKPDLVFVAVAVLTALAFSILVVLAPNASGADLVGEGDR